MIYSMTAFARQQLQDDLGGLTCEIRSINHRYLEISLHLPEVLRVFEMPLRELIRQKIKRGKVECLMRFQASQNAEKSLLNLNEALAKRLCAMSEKIAGYLRGPATISPTDILRFPDVLQAPEVDSGELKALVLSLADQTLTELVAARGREGNELKELFTQRANLIQTELAKARERLPSVIKEQNERLQQRFTEAKLQLDPSRLEQEMLIFAQRVDVAEEIERAETHLKEIHRVLKQGGVTGRRLDFILQELNREANTLGSKSVDSLITHAAVEMKVLIEQIREQVQNIE